MHASLWREQVRTRLFFLGEQLKEKVEKVMQEASASEEPAVSGRWRTVLLRVRHFTPNHDMPRKHDCHVLRVYALVALIQALQTMAMPRITCYMVCSCACA